MGNLDEFINYVLKPVDFKQFIDAVKQIGSFWAVLNELPPERSQ